MLCGHFTQNCIFLYFLEAKNPFCDEKFLKIFLDLCIYFVQKTTQLKDLTTIPWSLYSTKIENTTIKILNSFTSFHALHCKLLYWSVRQSLWTLFQEILMPSATFNRGHLRNILKFRHNFCVLCIIISVIIHKNKITQTDDHQSACELFRSCSYDPNKKKGHNRILNIW